MNQVRAIFISDVHLGTRHCQAGRLLEFLRDYESEFIYLLGDIVDLWSMSRGIHWTKAQNTVVQKLLKRAQHGACVVLVPGNHDEALREYDGVSFGCVAVTQHAVHLGVDGRRYLLVHGDHFDQVARYHRVLAMLGDHGYHWLMNFNVLMSRLRRMLGMAGHWSLAGTVKRSLKHAVAYVRDYELSVARHAMEHGYDGVICGHVHVGADKPLHGVRYLNCGDWVESCSAIVEHLDGRMELLDRSGVVVPFKSKDAATVASAKSV